MLGRKDYTREEFDHGETAIEEQLAVYVSDQSVVKMNIGDKIHLSAEEFERLSTAFFAELERKFL